MVTRRTTRTVPRPPAIPADLADAPSVLEDGDSWENVRAGVDLEVDPTAEHVELVGCSLTGVDLTSRRLAGFQARDVVFEGCDFSGAVLDGAQLDRVVFRGCRLTGAMLTAARLQDVVIEDCVATLANFRATRAALLFVRRTSLVEADFYTATLTDSAILDCDLSRANVRDLRAQRLHLHGSTLDRLVGATSLRGALIDDEQIIALGAAVLADIGVSIGDRPE